MTALTRDALPTTLTDVVTVRLPPDTRTPRGTRIRLLRFERGVYATARPTDAEERALVSDYPYRADWVGWHRGLCGAYGATPAQALDLLLCGRSEP